MGRRRKEQPPPVILAWKTPWTETPSRLQSVGLQRVGHDWAHASAHMHTHGLWGMRKLSGGQTSNLETHCSEPSQRVLGRTIEHTLNSASCLQALSNGFHWPNSTGKSISRDPYIQTTESQTPRHVAEKKKVESESKITNRSYTASAWVAYEIASCCCCLFAKSCSTLCDTMNITSPPGSSVHGISRARILESVVISFSRRSSWPRDWTLVSCLAGGFFTTEQLGKPLR